MFWEMEQQPEHRRKTQLRWARLTAMSQKGAATRIARRGWSNG